MKKEHYMPSGPDQPTPVCSSCPAAEEVLSEEVEQRREGNQVSVSIGIFRDDKPNINTILNIKRPWQKPEVEVAQQVNGGGDQTANHAPDETMFDVPES